MVNNIKIFFIGVTLIGLGFFICWTFGINTLKPMYYRVAEVTVEGQISGYTWTLNRSSSRNKPERWSINKEAGARRRTPVFTYSVPPNKNNYLTWKGSAPTFLWNYDFGDKITVVFPKNNPQDAHIFGLIFGLQMIIMNMILFLFGVYAISLGLTMLGLRR